MRIIYNKNITKRGTKKKHPCARCQEKTCGKPPARAVRAQRFASKDIFPQKAFTKNGAKRKTKWEGVQGKKKHEIVCQASQASSALRQGLQGLRFRVGGRV